MRINTFTVLFPWLRPLVSLIDSLHSPLLMNTSTPFYLLGDPSFGDRGANVHPLLSLVSHQLFTPSSLTLPGDTHVS
jgi:hypothetical protein